MNLSDTLIHLHGLLERGDAPSLSFAVEEFRGRVQRAWDVSRSPMVMLDILKFDDPRKSAHATAALVLRWMRASVDTPDRARSAVDGAMARLCGGISDEELDAILNRRADSDELPFCSARAGREAAFQAAGWVANAALYAARPGLPDEERRRFVSVAVRNVVATLRHAWKIGDIGANVAMARGIRVLYPTAPPLARLIRNERSFDAAT